VPDYPLSWYQALYDQQREEEMALLEYLELCRDHPEMYASPHERLLQAIGEPVLLDTSHDERLSRIFSNRIIRTYPSFVEFYGMEDVIDHIVSFLRHAAQVWKKLSRCSIYSARSAAANPHWRNNLKS
jgi:serine protein kinase